MDALVDRNASALSYCIERSCQNKAEVVAQDEHESGVRATLNLGHTFGHAIEAGMGYGNWLHGEAVATGMLMAADLSRRSGWLSDEDVEKTYMELMKVDKKVQSGHIRLVLLKSIGEAFICDDYDPALLDETLCAKTLF